MPAGPTGTVSGTIFGSDTDAPIRSGQLTLVPFQGVGGPQRHLVSGIDLQGHFLFRRVPEGNYIISANVPGYINPLPGSVAIRLSSMDQNARIELQKKLKDSAVEVEADQTANIAIRLDRAAEIDGSVLYDDGSPAAMLPLNITEISSDGAGGGATVEHDSYWDYLAAYSPSTDDRGRFRIIGLEPGTYFLSASVDTLSAEHRDDYLLAAVENHAAFGHLSVFYGDVFRQKDAKAIRVRQGDSVLGVDITIPLGKLHRVSGQVILQSTEKPPPSALIRILYADTREEARSIFARNGAFRVDYLPDGHYILTAEAGRLAIPDDDAAQRFLISGEKLFPGTTSGATAEMPLLVNGDLTDVTITIPDGSAIQGASSN